MLTVMKARTVREVGTKKCGRLERDFPSGRWDSVSIWMRCSVVESCGRDWCGGCGLERGRMGKWELWELKSAGEGKRFFAREDENEMRMRPL